MNDPAWTPYWRKPTECVGGGIWREGRVLDSDEVFGADLVQCICGCGERRVVLREA